MHPHLKRLVIERQLGHRQAAAIHKHWKDTPGDLWAQPETRSVPGTTRTYIDDLRGQLNKTKRED